MDKDQVSGKSDQIAGKVKQRVSEAVGNDDLANEGVADQVKGHAKETWGNAKDAVHQEAEERANTARDTVAHRAEHMKNIANDKIDAAKEERRLEREKKDRTA